jgi:hypothetical protein
MVAPGVLPVCPDIRPAPGFGWDAHDAESDSGCLPVHAIDRLVLAVFEWPDRPRAPAAGLASRAGPGGWYPAAVAALVVARRPKLAPGHDLSGGDEISKTRQNELRSLLVW